VSEHQAAYPVRSMSRVLEVSPGGFYAWLKRPPSKRVQDDQMLTQPIKEIHKKSKGTYGAPRIHPELAEEGFHVGRKRVARLMRKAHYVIHHSDQGGQYTSIAFGHRCREAGIRPSMGPVGDCFDNAMCESFFATLECKLLDRTSFHTPAEARQAVFQFIEGWYNPHRRHSGIDYLSPNRYEARHACTPCFPSRYLSTKAG
jgi:transposase InsO family protein